VRFVKLSIGTSCLLLFGALNTLPTAGAAPSRPRPGASARTAAIVVPTYITDGPDGALWFTDLGNSTDRGSIGRITTSGKVTIFSGGGINEPAGITVGPDGALWFTNSAGNSIGRITTSGEITHYTVPGVINPLGITKGPDGDLWFTGVAPVLRTV
jgi:virginiamycin B lyase